MIRPRYESADDLAKEAAVLDKFVKHLTDCSGHRHCYSWLKLPEIRYVLDAALMIDHFVRGWVEVKCRVGDPSLYEHWYVSLHKFQKGLFLSDYSALPFFMIFDWDGHTFAGRFTDLPRTPIQWNGRTDRQDDKDTEPVVLLPRSAFKPVGIPATSGLLKFPTPGPACASSQQSTAPGQSGLEGIPYPRV